MLGVKVRQAALPLFADSTGGTTGVDDQSV